MEEGKEEKARASIWRCGGGGRTSADDLQSRTPFQQDSKDQEAEGRQAARAAALDFARS